LRTPTDIDSKFRYVILASKRAKQLLKGAKPKLKSKSKNLIRIAQEEVDRGMVDYEIVHSRPEDLEDIQEDIFIGEELEFEPEIPSKKEASEKENLIEEIQDQISRKGKAKDEQEDEEEDQEEQTDEAEPNEDDDFEEDED
jgi:DNA-directed RNA polymerase subunit K/omega